MSLMDEFQKIRVAEIAQAEKEWTDESTVLTFPTDPYIAPPDTNPKTAFGIQKPGFNAIPPVALIYLGAVMGNGAMKYGTMNWRDHAVSFSVYYNAMLRHLFAVLDGEWIDPESGQPHLAHVMAGAGIVLDAHANGKLNDDRPKLTGQAAKMVRG